MRFLILSLACLIAFRAEGADTARVLLRVGSDAIPDDATVYVAGNHESLGNWQVDKVALDEVEDGLWQINIEVDEGAHLAFKFTLGSWEKEALTEAGGVPGNHELQVVGSTTQTYQVVRWRTPMEPGVDITGIVEVHEDMQSHGLRPRDVQVWLPPDYAESTDRRYPVLYLHDGQQVFDPATSTHGVDWGVDETLTRLIDAGRMEPILVVAISNTEDRGEEYMDESKLGAYMSFVVDTVKPFVDEAYRTMSDRDHTAVMGSSAGGHVSFQLLWKYPQVFSMAGCLSPAFFLNFQKLRAGDWPGDHSIRLYIDNGGLGLEKMLQPGCDVMLETLPSMGLTFGRDLFWQYDAEAEHSEAAWNARVDQPLLMMFGVDQADRRIESEPPPQPVYHDSVVEAHAIVELDDFLVVGLQTNVSWYFDQPDYRSLWDRLKERVADIAHVRHPDASEYVGLMLPEKESTGFRYVAGVVVSKADRVPDDMTTESVPSHRCLQFLHRGKADTIRAFGDEVRMWWLPRNRYETGENYIELYGDNYDPNSDDADMQLLVPLVE